MIGIFTFEWSTYSLWSQLLATTTPFTRYGPVYDYVDPEMVTVIYDRMHLSIVDFPDLSFLEVLYLITDKELDFIIRDDRDMYSMTM